MWKQNKLRVISTTDGFTLLEALFSFSIFLIVMMIVPIASSYLMLHQYEEASVQEMEWIVFVNQLKKEVRMADRFYVDGQRLVLQADEQTIQYEQYQSLLRRRVNFTGHEVVLQNVASASFIQHGRSVELVVSDSFSQEHRVHLFQSLQWGSQDEVYSE